MEIFFTCYPLITEPKQFPIGWVSFPVLSKNLSHPQRMNENVLYVDGRLHYTIFLFSISKFHSVFVSSCDDAVWKSHCVHRYKVVKCNIWYSQRNLQISFSIVEVETRNLKWHSHNILDKFTHHLIFWITSSTHKLLD